MTFKTCCLLFLSTIGAAVVEHVPQVYEHLDEQLPQYIRLPRHLDKSQHLNIYQSQQDRLKSIYGRQQQVDLKNLKPLRATFGPFRGNSDWKPFQPSFSNQNQERSVDLNVAASEAEAKVSSETQDQPIEYVYVSPNLLKDNLALDADSAQEILENPAQTESHDINDLQVLLGKSPSAQLQGLQKLLDTKSAVKIDHNGSPPAFEDLQKQLDAVNKARADNVLAEAQKQAQAHIQAQHEAILRAQKQAQKEAFAKIEAHNRGAAHEETPSSTPIPEVSALQERPLEQVLVSSPGRYSGHYASASNDLRNAKPQIPVRFATTRLQFAGPPPQLYSPGEVQTYSPVSPYTPQLIQRHQIPSNEATLVNLVHNIPHQTYREESEHQLHGDKVSEVRSKRGVHINYSFGESGIIVTDLDRKKPSDQVRRNIEDNKGDKNVIVINNSNRKEEVHLLAPQSHSFHIVGGNGKRRRYSFQKIIPKVLRAENKVDQYAAKYSFGYRVLDEKHGNDYGHQEARDGIVTKGRYFVNLPDGRKQNVEYYSDKSGYHARVSYENIGVHTFDSNELVGPAAHEHIEEDPK